MKRKMESDPAALLRQGLKALGNHRPDKAIPLFRAAVDRLPPEAPLDLSRTLYWLAVSLQQMGQSDLALRSLATAQKVRPRGLARRVYLRSINEYGMAKRATSELDDFFAFMHLQLAKYLGRKSGKRFTSYDEHEAVMHTLFAAWKTLQASGLLTERSCDEKAILFRRIQPSFPTLTGKSINLPRLSPAKTPGKPSGQRCPCGSGLSYLQCCGRIQSIKELL
ncbi:MAG: SEC-C domain-containing protein [Spirochaetaceae bacterium]|nr:SEC-C domain-containing protein [Spirochaetaceae bacterium]